MSREYLQLNKEDISRWMEEKNPVLIDSYCGSGKTTALKTVYSCVKEMSEGEEKIIRVLVLEPRTALVEQVKQDMGKEKLELITVDTIQSIENCTNRAMVLNQYQIIIVDECHAMISDNGFNQAGDNLLRDLLSGTFDGLAIFMTGTNYYELEKLYEKYSGKVCEVVRVEPYFDYIQDNTIWSYSYNRTAAFIINQAVREKNEKVLLCCDKIRTINSIIELSGLPKELFYIVVSKMNEKNRNLYKENEKNIEYTIENKGFPEGKKVFCCTRTFEMGVSIIDENVKTIVIDTDDISTLVQFVNRIRFAYGQRVTINYRKLTTNEMKQNHKKATEMTWIVDLFLNNRGIFDAKYGSDYSSIPGHIVYARNVEGVAKLVVNECTYTYWMDRREQFAKYNCYSCWEDTVSKVFGGAKKGQWVSKEVQTRDQILCEWKAHGKIFRTPDERAIITDLFTNKTFERINDEVIACNGRYAIHVKRCGSHRNAWYIEENLRFRQDVRYEGEIVGVSITD